MVVIKARPLLAGHVVIRGGRFSLNNASSISAKTTGPVAGQGIDIAAKEEVDVLFGCTLSTDTTGKGDAGPISVQAPKIVVDSFARISAESQLLNAGGRAGDIRLESQQTVIKNQGLVSTTSLGSGNSGSITVTAAASLDITASGGDGETGLQADSQSDFRRGGNAGHIEVKTGQLRIDSGGTITANAFGAGNGGSIHIQAQGIAMDGRNANSQENTGIAAVNTDGGGGAISLQTDQLSILGGATLFAGTYGTGGGGSIQIQGSDRLRASRILIDGAGGASFTGIGAPPGAVLKAARGEGIAQISVHADQLEIYGGGAGGGIDSTTQGSAQAGKIDIDAGGIRIDGRGTFKPAGILGATPCPVRPRRKAPTSTSGHTPW